MKILFTTLILSLFAISCSKEENHEPPEDRARTVKAVVWIESKYATGPMYYKPGILFNKPMVNAIGTAVVSFSYFGGGTVESVLNFNIPSSNGYFEFTDIVTDGSDRPSNIKMKSFKLTSGNYDVTVIN